MSEKSRGGATVASLAVLCIAVGFSIYVSAHHHVFTGKTESYSALFNSANGLKSGARVMISGVPVGQVEAISIDGGTELARVDFRLDRRIPLTTHTTIAIMAPDMTSDNALMVIPGRGGARIKPHETITSTRDQTSLEQQVSNYIFGGKLD